MYSKKTHTLKLPSDIYLILSLCPLIFAAIISIVIVFLFKSFPEQLPLFYSLPWGENQLATSQQFFILPATIVLITLLNLSLSWQLHPSQVFFKRVLTAIPIICSIILLTTFIKIIFIFL